MFGGQAGYYTDGETGLVLCTFRYYDPQTGRWLNRDPSGYDGGVNLYAYCQGNPTNSLDPLGLCSDGNNGHGPKTWADKVGDAADIIDAVMDKTGVKWLAPNGGGLSGVTGMMHTIANTQYIGESAGHLSGGEVNLKNVMGTLNDAIIVYEWVSAGHGAASRLKGGFNNCFVAGTVVQMSDGTTQAIESVQAGDVVKSRDSATGKDVARRVVRTFVNAAHGTLLTLRFANGEEITTTLGHPFYVGGRGFVLAGDLGIGTSIVTRAGTHGAAVSTAVVGITRHGEGKSATVYNFEVEGTHTYFVGEKDGGLWVHNQSVWTSPGGLEYRATSKQGNRVAHIFEHLAENPTKPKHTVFEVGNSADLIGLVDEAWAARTGTGVPTGLNTAYDIPMNRVVGTGGETTIRVVVKTGTYGGPICQDRFGR